MVLKKAEVQKLVDGLPEEVDIDDLMYRLYLRKKISASQADIAAGRVHTHEDVKKFIDQWKRQPGGA